MYEVAADGTALLDASPTVLRPVVGPFATPLAPRRAKRASRRAPHSAFLPCQSNMNSTELKYQQSQSICDDYNDDAIELGPAMQALEELWEHDATQKAIWIKYFGQLLEKEPDAPAPKAPAVSRSDQRS